jgi:hypothetical protein
MSHSAAGTREGPAAVRRVNFVKENETRPKLFPESRGVRRARE